MLPAGELRSLAKAADAGVAVLIDDVADGRAARQPRGRVALAALDRDVQLLEVAPGALDLGGVLKELLRHARRIGGGLKIAAALDREPFDRLAGRLDAVDDLLRPPRLDADDDGSGDVGVAPRADHRPEEQIQVFAELKPTVRVRQRQRPRHHCRYLFGAGVGDVIHGQDDHMIAYADAPVGPAIRHDFSIDCHWLLLRSKKSAAQARPLHTSGPPFGFHVVHVYVLAGLDRLDDPADLAAVLDHVVARLVIFQRDLVPERDVHRGLGAQRLVGVERSPFQGLPGFDVDDGDADGVAFIVDQKLNHG